MNVIRSRIPEDTRRPIDERAIERVRDAIARIGYGSVTLTLQDFRVVQIEVTEKSRLDR